MSPVRAVEPTGTKRGRKREKGGCLVVVGLETYEVGIQEEHVRTKRYVQPVLLVSKRISSARLIKVFYFFLYMDTNTAELFSDDVKVDVLEKHLSSVCHKIGLLLSVEKS